MTAITVLQAALEAENAAIYGYGVAGAYLAGSGQATAIRDWTDHNEARDTLSAMITQLGATPAAAAAFYALPFPVHDSRTARALAAYLGVVAVDDLRLRTFGALAMQAPARRAAFWRGRTQPFPGLIS